MSKSSQQENPIKLKWSCSKSLTQRAQNKMQLNDVCARVITLGLRLVVKIKKNKKKISESQQFHTQKLTKHYSTNPNSRLMLYYT